MYKHRILFFHSHLLPTQKRVRFFNIQVNVSTKRDGRGRGRYFSSPRHRQEKKDKEWRRIVKALALIEAYP